MQDIGKKQIEKKRGKTIGKALSTFLSRGKKKPGASGKK